MDELNSKNAGQAVISKENFLENSIINETLQNIEQIENKCKNINGEDAVNLRIKQLTYAKILHNVYGKDLNVLIKAYTSLGCSYMDINYYEQATEHILTAFKLIQSVQTDEMSIADKEFQIKVLINLAKCYMEFPEKLTASLSICEKCLELNKKVFGNKHLSNADILYVLAKVIIMFIIYCQIIYLRLIEN
jgi:tetratricopeptide (TPR) repeat protein